MYYLDVQSIQLELYSPQGKICLAARLNTEHVHGFTYDKIHEHVIKWLRNILIVSS